MCSPWRLLPLGFSLQPLFSLSFFTTFRKAKEWRPVTDEDMEAQRGLSHAQSVPRPPATQATLPRPAPLIPDTHRLHYLGTHETFLLFLGLRENLGARGDL